MLMFYKSNNCIFSFIFRCIALEHPASCMSATSIRIIALVNIAIFLARQTFVFLQNYFSEDNDPHFMIILSRIRIDEEMIDRVLVSDNNIAVRVSETPITLDKELQEIPKTHPGIRFSTSHSYAMFFQVFLCFSIHNGKLSNVTQLQPRWWIYPVV